MKEIRYIELERLHPHPDNPRKTLGDLAELADSIKAKGIYQMLRRKERKWIRNEQ